MIVLNAATGGQEKVVSVGNYQQAIKNIIHVFVLYRFDEAFNTSLLPVRDKFFRTPGTYAERNVVLKSKEQERGSR